MFDSVCAANFSKTPLGVNIFLNKILITNVSGKARPAQSGRSRALARFLPCFGRFCTFAPGKRLALHLHLTVTNWPPPRPRKAAEAMTPRWVSQTPAVGFPCLGTQSEATKMGVTDNANVEFFARF